jgi:hypothetical protein
MVCGGGEEAGATERGGRAKLATVGVGAGPEGKGNYQKGLAPATTVPGGDESAMN